MEAAGSSETLVTIYDTTQRYIPEDHNLQENSATRHLIFLFLRFSLKFSPKITVDGLHPMNNFVSQLCINIYPDIHYSNMSNYNNPQAKISMLHFLNLKISSAWCSNPLLPNESLNGGFTLPGLHKQNNIYYFSRT
jgi:hypothetical protein